MLFLPGISSRIDSCAGMIAKAAVRSYRFLSSNDRRWIDVEDLFQESMLSAVVAERRYRPSSNCKYSTYLYRGLSFHLTKLGASFQQQKRVCSRLVELDAILLDQLEPLPVPVVPDKSTELISVFLEFYRWLSAGARVVLIRSLLLHKHQSLHSAGSRIALSELREVAGRCEVACSDLEELGKNDMACRKALTQVATCGTIRMGHETEVRLLECVGCSGLFTLTDVARKRFVVATMTCRACYRKLQQSPPEISCFGKLKNGGEGYSQADVECRLHCRDRQVCLAYATGKNGRSRDTMAKKAKAAEPKAAEDELKDVDFSDVEKPSNEKETKKAAKAAKEEPAKGKKEAKPAKSPKEKKEKEGERPPSDVGAKWPHKEGSMMQYCFQRAYAGIKAEQLKKDVESAGYNWAIMLMVLRSGRTGKKRLTHTWKLNEEGGTLKISNVKYHGKSAE